MFERLEEIEQRFDELGSVINEPGAVSGLEWRAKMKEHASLLPIVEKFREYRSVLLEIKGNEEHLDAESDDEIRQLFKGEIYELRIKSTKIAEELRILLLPKDPNDDKNVIVEIRGGAGGDEAALFAREMFRMYQRYAERRRWKTEIMSLSESDLGGVKEIIFMISGKGVYSRLKYESGVHRVQRVPSTEANGRIHTSTITVAVLPEAEDVDVELDMNDVRVDVFRSSGNGGQSVNTTDSAVRVTHLPTGIVISCQDEKSQLKNKDRALKILRAKLFDLETEKQRKELSAARKSQVGTGNRNERVRTYNFPQGRVTDHRVNLTLYRIDSVLDGDFDELTNALVAFYQAEALSKG